MNSYAEIHPVYRNQQEEMQSVHNGARKPVSEFLFEGEPIVINLNTILQIRDESLPDGSAKLNRLVISLTDHNEDIIIRKEEADNIKKQLIRDGGDATAKELGTLNVVLRDLWSLLRARLH